MNPHCNAETCSAEREVDTVNTSLKDLSPSFDTMSMLKETMFFLLGPNGLRMIEYIQRLLE